MLLDDGKVLVIGGTGEAPLMHTSTELFDPFTETRHPPTLRSSRQGLHKAWTLTEFRARATSESCPKAFGRRV